jgi:DNA-directed RNA polymerase specialized sigma subunit
MGMKGYSSSYCCDELLDTARFALVKAAERYKPGKALFKTYAEIIIRGALKDFWKKEDYYRGFNRGHQIIYKNKPRKEKATKGHNYSIDPIAFRRGLMTGGTL